MNNTPDTFGAGSHPPDDFENRLLAVARTFSYPPTPDVSGAVLRRLPRRHAARTRRTLAAVGILMALLLTILFAVPQVRAAVLDWIRIGAVRIFIG